MLLPIAVLNELDEFLDLRFQIEYRKVRFHTCNFTGKFHLICVVFNFSRGYLIVPDVVVGISAC